MTKKLIWRLKEQPSTESLRELVKDKLLTNDEAREILFSSQEETDRDVKSLEAEIKFLRDLVEKLSQNKSQIVEVIKEVKVPYSNYDWYQPYHYWCGNRANNVTILPTNGTIASYTASSENCTFDSIQTF